MSGVITKERFLRLIGQYKKLSDLERKAMAKNMIAFNPEKKEYSLANKCLLAMQEGKVGQYGGFGAWIKLGKVVKKGEKGFLIAAPIISKKKNEAKTDDEDCLVRFFRTAVVFHESQLMPLTPKNEL